MSYSIFFAPAAGLMPRFDRFLSPTSLVPTLGGIRADYKPRPNLIPYVAYLVPGSGFVPEAYQVILEPGIGHRYGPGTS